MELQLYSNNASSSLSSSVLSVDSSLTLESGGGGKFALFSAAGQWQVLTLTDGTSHEIVKVTARSGDVLTVVRAQEGTAAAAWAAGTKVEARVTAGLLGKFLANTNSDTDGGIALGTGSAADAFSSIALGSGCVASAGGLAIGKSAKTDKWSGVALGVDMPRAYRGYQFSCFAIPCIPRDDWWATNGAQYNSGQETAWAGQFVDLGTPQAWAANTVYTEGTVVQPTTPSGYQYRLWHEAFDSAVLNTVTSGTTEPTWPAAIGGNVDADASATHQWIGSDMAVGADETIPPGMVFYPTEVGFICFNHSGVTAAPYVSIGTVADPTLLVNNQQLTNITAASMRHAFTGIKHGITDLRCKLMTPATGASARFHGRFYAKGIFIQTQG